MAGEGVLKARCMDGVVRRSSVGLKQRACLGRVALSRHGRASDDAIDLELSAVRNREYTEETTPRCSTLRVLTEGA